MMKIDFNNDTVQTETEVSEKDGDTAMSLITALIVKGLKPEDVSRVLAVSHAVAHTIFSPNQELAKENTNEVHKLVHSMVDDLWPTRAGLEADLKAKVGRLSPFHQMNNMINNILRRGIKPSPATPDDGVKAAPEPQTEQFRR